MKFNFFKNKTILITGGTGSFGKSMVNKILRSSNPKKVIIFSRDELKQFEMSNDLNFKNNKKIRFFIGDIREKDRLKLAFNGVDIVIHAAALKQISTAEYNPFEAIKTNIIGAQNIIEAALELNVKKIIALSTDKAVDPINLYGATKLAADKLFIAANNLVGKKKISFSVVRYGNVIGSRGSVIPFFRELIEKKEKYIPVTDKNMTRFFISLEEATNFVSKSIYLMNGGEIFVPKMPSVKILDLALILKSKNQKIIYTGIRPGEKLHEILISNVENQNILEFNDSYIILPRINFFNDKKFKTFLNKSKLIKKPFLYSSESNVNFFSKNEIKNILDY
jgi:UDP-N-acetylglucosamine 4,6-dehydratase